MALEKTLIRILTLSACCAFVVVALASNAGAADRAPRVLILGDSLTKGYGLLPEQAYPALLQKRAVVEGFTGVKVLNGGVSGDTTAGGLRRMSWLLKQRIDVLVLALGGNDGLRGIPPEETAKNLQAIIEKALKNNPRMQLVLAGMEMPDNMGQDYVKAFRATFPAIARKNKIPLIPLLLEGVGGVPELNQPDLIHPNEEGQQKLADTVWKTLKPVLEKIRKAGAAAG